MRHDIGRFDDGVQAVQIAYSDGPRRSNTSRSTPEYLGACGSILSLRLSCLQCQRELVLVFLVRSFAIAVNMCGTALHDYGVSMEDNSTVGRLAATDI